MEDGAIGLHTKPSQIRIVTADGAAVFERRIVTRADQVAAVFGGRDRMRILLESSTESEWVATGLEALGHEVVVADPNFAAMYGSRTRRIKTDQRDVAAVAEATARACITGRIGSVRRNGPFGSACWCGTSSSACAPN